MVHSAIAPREADFGGFRYGRPVSVASVREPGRVKGLHRILEFGITVYFSWFVRVRMVTRKALPMTVFYRNYGRGYANRSDSRRQGTEHSSKRGVLREQLWTEWRRSQARNVRHFGYA